MKEEDAQGTQDVAEETPEEETKPRAGRKKAAKTPRAKAKGGRARKTPARTPATRRRVTRAASACEAEEDPDKTLTAESQEEEQESAKKVEEEVGVATPLRSSRRTKLTALQRLKEEDKKESSGTEEYSHNEDADVGSLTPHVTSTPKAAGLITS